jgi:hypothetical protein
MTDSKVQTLLFKYMDTPTLSNLWLVEVLQKYDLSDIDECIKELAPIYNEFTRWLDIVEARKMMKRKRD